MMKKLILAPLGLALAGCAGTPHKYEDAYVPEARDYRIEEPKPSEEAAIPEPATDEEFVSANGEICSVVAIGMNTKAICKSGSNTTEVQGIISGSI